MSKSIALMGYQAKNQATTHYSLERIMADLGQNTGNLAFWHAVESHIDMPKLYVNADFDPLQVNATCSALVLPAANFIGRHLDLTPYTQFLKKIDVPIVVLGLGMQFELDDAAQETSPSTDDFINMLISKNATVATRGQQTADFLSGRGLRNVTVTGCPSNYITPDLTFKYESLYERVLLNFQIGTKYQAALPFIGNWVDGGNASMVWQGFEDPIAYLHDCCSLDSDLMTAFCDSLRPGMPLPEFKRWLFRNSTYFFGAREWMEFCSRFTLSIGTRFHGNMLAIQSGVPAVFVVHDRRTQEMVELFKLPHVSLERISTYRSMEKVLSIVDADMRPYIQARKELGIKYFELIQNAGISIPEIYRSFLSQPAELSTGAIVSRP